MTEKRQNERKKDLKGKQWLVGQEEVREKRVKK
jgi:hypothetical protein